jgi:hypothetical protein
MIVNFKSLSFASIFLALIYNNIFAVFRGSEYLIQFSGFDKVFTSLGIAFVFAALPERQRIKATVSAAVLCLVLLTLAYLRASDYITIKAVALAIYRSFFVVFFGSFGYFVGFKEFKKYLNSYTYLLVFSLSISLLIGFFYPSPGHQIDGNLPMILFIFPNYLGISFFSFATLLYTQKRSLLFGLAAGLLLIQLLKVSRNLLANRFKISYSLMSVPLLLSILSISFSLGFLDKFKKSFDVVNRLDFSAFDIFNSPGQYSSEYLYLHMFSSGRLSGIACLINNLSDSNFFNTLFLGYGQGWSVNCYHPLNYEYSINLNSAHSDIFSLIIIFGFFFSFILIAWFLLTVKNIIDSIELLPPSAMHYKLFLERSSLYLVVMLFAGFFADQLISMPFYLTFLGSMFRYSHSQILK